MKLVLHAPNIHCGGGATLLTALLTAQSPIVRHVNVDERYLLPGAIATNVAVHRVPPTIRGRLLAEWHLRSSTASDDIVLCVGNLPPLFPISAHVVLFIQNRLLLDGLGLKAFPPPILARLLAERTWLRLTLRHVRRVIVQSRTMQNAVMRQLRVRADILPFLPNRTDRARPACERDFGDNRIDFLYVASGEPHKNHVRLIEAWQLLACEGIRPRLCITLSPLHDRRLCKVIEDATLKFGLDISNVGVVLPKQIQDLYARAGALVYPSLVESFGLPLLEAAGHNLPILASELDYVRDIVDPVQTFDPNSPLSIARAIKRFLHIPEKTANLLAATEFLAAVVEDAMAERHSGPCAT